MKIEELFQIKDQVAIVTGASQGIGKDISKLLGSCGAKVVLIARNEEKLNDLKREMENSGYEVMSIPCDVTQVQQLSEVMKRVYERFKRIDILINNAGTNITKEAEEVTETDWDTVLDLNLKSAFFCSQAASKYMKKGQKGKIINMSSQMSQVGYYKRAAYCSSKGGLMQQTRALAIEWAKDHIKVNSIAPTFIETPMTETMFQDKEFEQDVLNRIPLGRLAKVEDLFGAVLYLSSSGSDMVTGQTLFVDGGWTVW